MNTKEAKVRFQEIAKGYSREVLQGYISFFASSLTNRKSRDFQVRLNGLRLKVYLRELKCLNEK